MAKHIRYFFFLSLIVLAVSCKKKTPEDIGLPILPGEDLLGVEHTDTLTLISHTLLEDSIPTKNVTPLMLGNMNDPIFGITKASIFTQLLISKTNPNFGTNPVLDSAVLSVVYANGQYYGKKDAQKFKVYEVSETISKDSAYKSNSMLQYSTELGSAFVSPKVDPATDSVVVNGVKYPPHLRINLDTNIFGKFLRAPFTTTNYTSNTAFQSTFKGIYLASSTGVGPGQAGGIFYMDLINTYTRITLFYHNDTDTTSYFFGISKEATSTRFSHFEHDYNGATEIKSQIADTIPPLSQKDRVFVQSMAGVRTRISIPYLMDLYKNGKIAINKAELVLPVNTSSFGTLADSLAPPAKLVATIADDKLGPVIMPDYFEGSSYFGGDYDAAKGEYRFNIARYVQQVLTGKRTNQDLYIITNNRPTTANRVELYGGSMLLPKHMQLRITYTPLY